MIEQATYEQLHTRIRRAPRRFSVPGSTPVLFFGDLFSARIATVGLNPSDREFLDREGVELRGSSRRFQTLESLGAADRASLTDAQCAQAVETMRGYFGEGKPIYGWFRGLARVTEGMGASLAAGEAAHLDLVQEATQPTWSSLPPDEQAALLELDLSFLGWEIRTFPVAAVICAGKTVSNHVRSLFPIEIEAQGELALVKWWAGQAEIDGRRVGFAGWNLPLARPTGLGREGETRLGELLADRLGLSR